MRSALLRALRPRATILAIVALAGLAAAAGAATALVVELEAEAPLDAPSGTRASATVDSPETGVRETVSTDGDGVIDLSPREAGAASAASPSPSTSFASKARTVAATVGPAAPATLLAAAIGILSQFAGHARLASSTAMYSRIKESDLLDHPGRAAVYDHVKTNPGTSLSDVHAATGFGWGTTVYHLQRLRGARLVTTAREGPTRRFWVVGATPRRGDDEPAALGHDTARAVHAHVVESPGVRQKDLCDALAMTASSASKNLKKLALAGLVTAVKEGREVRYYASRTGPETSSSFTMGDERTASA